MKDAFIEVQGDLLEIRLKSEFDLEHRGGGRRGKVKGFSRQSRNRMIFFMARLQTSKIRASFLTLTFHEFCCPKCAQKALKRFLMRLRRAFPGVSGLWRKEYQKTGRPHFHLMLFGLPFVPQSKLQEVWTDCTGEDRSIVHIKLASGKRSIMSYISKYMSKAVDGAELSSLEDSTYQHMPRDSCTGRLWGWLNKANLPLGEKRCGFLIGRTAYGWAREVMWEVSRGRSNCSEWTARLLNSEVYQFFELFVSGGGMELDDYANSKFAPNAREMGVQFQKVSRFA